MSEVIPQTIREIWSTKVLLHSAWQKMVNSQAFLLDYFECLIPEWLPLSIMGRSDLLSASFFHGMRWKLSLSAAGFLLMNHTWIHWEWHPFETSMSLVISYHRNTVIPSKLPYQVEIEHRDFPLISRQAMESRWDNTVVLPWVADKMDPKKEFLP